MLNSKIIWALLIIYVLSYSLFSQDIFIAGEIRSKKTEDVIGDVNIYILKHTFGTISDEYGQFYLKIPDSNDNMTVVFHHIGFDTLQVVLREAKEQRIFYLSPRVMTGMKITVEAKREGIDIAKDLPQMITIFDTRKFENQGYTDAGDLLKTEQSIQIDEELSGKKTIAIRAGNADDVIVLYNGVKLNNPYDNSFDLSLINLDDVEQVEVIKGNNSVLFGSDGFSGIVNIVPKINKDYSVRFSQRFGTYDSGDWNLQLNHTFKNRFHISYSHKEGGSRKSYADSPDNSEFLENKSSHQTANIIYSFSDDPQKNRDNSISAMYMRSKIDYRNNRYYEELSNLNQLASLRYIGNIGKLKNWNLVGSYQWLDHDQQIPTVTGLFLKQFNNQSMKFNIEKIFDYSLFNLLIGYQFEGSELDFRENRNYLDEIAIGLESVLLTRQKHGVLSIIKIHTPTDSEHIQTADLDVSFRYDNVTDQQKNVILRNEYNELEYYPGTNFENKWDDTMLKLSAHFAGYINEFSFNIYGSWGSNYKFPSLFQQLSSPAVFDVDNPEITSSLKPEKNRSAEIGIEILQETKKAVNIDNWEANLSYFNNLYDNKFRTYYSPGNPIAFYDNVPNASISGVEGRIRTDFDQKIVSAELGVSRYFISDKAAFPFKSDTKYIINLSVDYSSLFFRFHGFMESEQQGWYRTIEGDLSEVDLPGYKNIDLILGTNFQFKNIKFVTSVSVRNLLADDTQIYGLSIRDRRFYILFGVEF